MKRCLLTGLVIFTVFIVIQFKNFHWETCRQVSCALLILHDRRNTSGQNLTYDNIKAKKHLLLDSHTCKILNEGPETKEFIPSPRKTCPDPHFFISDDGIIYLPKYGYRNFQNCCYSEIYRVEEPSRPHTTSDWEVKLETCKPILAAGVPLQSPYVRVECLLGNSKRRHVDFSSAVFPPAKNSNRTAKKVVYWHRRRGPASSRPPNVIFIGVNGVSRLQMMRALPKTRKFVLENDFIELKGFTKIGINNFANMMAMLAGSDEKRYKCWRSQHKYPLDDCPFAWKNFSSRHYITGIVEDSPAISMFNYDKIGFVQQPTDYYPRTMMVAAHKYLDSGRVYGLTRNCFNGLTLFGTVFNYTRRFLSVVASKYPYFLVSAYKTLPGTPFTTIAGEDGNFRELLRDMVHDPNYSGNNTLIIFHSTHGAAYSSSFKSYYEEGLPMFLIRFPPQLRKRYPDWYENLKENANRLTSPLDVHAMLEDILSVTSKTQVFSYGQRTKDERPVYSLFESIPRNRSCQSALIPEQYCRCGATEETMVQKKLSHRLAQTVMENISSVLAPIIGGNMCVPLNLSSIQYVRVVGEGHVLRNVSKKKFGDYRVGIETFPSQALFEAVVRDYQDSGPIIVGDISRMDSPKNQSFCVRNEEYSKFCYCYDVGVHARISKLKELMKWSSFTW